MESIGFRTKSDPVYPDLAFSLPKAMMPECNDGNRVNRVIGVGVKDYYGQRGLRNLSSEDFYSTFINQIGTFVTWLLKNKYAVRVLIGDVRYDNPVKQDLIEFLQRNEIIYNEDDRIIYEPIFSVEQLLSQLARTDVVVSPRFHNIILALMLNKPVVSLSYNEKFDSLMTDLGLKKFCQNMDELDIDKLIEQFMELENNAEKLMPNIQQKVGEYRRALDEQYTLIFKDARP
jgi:polysaccharide pyruvyl transferase WcaK-like protein